MGERAPESTDDLPGKPEEKEEPAEVNQQKVVNFRPTAMAPTKAPNEARTVVIATTIAIVVLVGGLAAGFIGFRFLEGQTASADTPTQTTSKAPKTIDTVTTTGAAPTEGTATASWTSYENTKNKYTLKYPDNWYSQGADSPTSSSIQLTSFKPEASGSGEISEGYKIEVVFQDTNGKTLTSWIEATNAAMSAKVSETKKTTIDTQIATQQTLSAPVKSISTYVIHNDKVMMITYYAAQNDFEKGISIYEDILNSIKLNS